MSRYKLATLALLVSGAIALPAAAQVARIPEAVASIRDTAPGDARPGPDDRRGGRYDTAPGGLDAGGNVGGRQDRRGNRPGEGGSGSQGPSPDGRADARADYRGARHDARYDRRDDRYEHRDHRREVRYDRRHDRRDFGRDRYDYDRRDRYDYDRHDRHDRHDRRDRYVRQHDRRWNGYHWHPQYRYRAPVRYVYPRGYYARHWSVGHRLPHGYYDRHYYVDYRAYRLPPPPYGYHWIRVDRDVLLVALATGLIRDALYGVYY